MPDLNFGSTFFPDPVTNRPIAAGSVYLGEPGTDPEIPANQLTVQAQQEDGSLVTLSQPITLSVGGVPTYNGSIVKIIMSENYSIKVLDKNGAQVYYFTETETYVGSQGYQGPQGITGNQGAQGDTGPQGYQGHQGNQGYQGPQGVLGAQGPIGPQGYQGFQGVYGTQGPQGVLGAQGFQGDQGVTGYQGPRGYQGYQGITGSQGSQGDSGPQGYQGPQGQQGYQGDPMGVSWQGAYLSGTTYGQGEGVSYNGTLYVSLSDSNTGNQPDTSPAYWDQFVGAQGPQGPQGSQGLTGPQGLTGSQGTTGPQGTAGIQGEEGPQGPQGNVGSQGAVGSQGNQGYQGSTGSQGLIGPQGYQGAAGPQGNQGYQGPTGPQGVIGPQGYTGSQGPTGSQGLTGSQGPTGQQGPDGNQGPQGDDGLLESVLTHKVTITSGGSFVIGSGTKDVDLDGIAIDNTEIVGQIDGDDTFYLRTDGTGWFSQYISTNISGLSGYTAGDAIIAEADTQRGPNGSATPIKYKEIEMTVDGTFRIAFDLKCVNAFYPTFEYDGYGRIYKNGVAFGTQRGHVGTQGGYTVTYSQDLAFNNGDLCQLYAYSEGGNTNAYVSEFKVKTAFSVNPIVIVD